MYVKKDQCTVDTELGSLRSGLRTTEMLSPVTVASLLQMVWPECCHKGGVESVKVKDMELDA